MDLFVFPKLRKDFRFERAFEVRFALEFESGAFRDFWILGEKWI